MKLRCPLPECRKTFQWAADEPWPEDCPMCGAFIGMSEEQKGRVAAPFLALKGGQYAKAVDQVYRDAERSSEARIEQAVAMTPGATKDDFSALKVTNYSTNMVEGESAVKLQPSQEFQRNAATLQQAGVPIQNGGMNLTGQHQMFSSQVRTGPEPNAGVRALDRLRSAHRGNVDPRMNTPVSSLPALETQQPGYVPRGSAITPGVG